MRESEIMGSIISSQLREDGKVILEVSVDYEEALHLKGHMNDVHVFSEKTAMTKANLSQRGKNDATKYFLVPRELRKDLKFNGPVNCQRMDTKTQTVFIYVIDKLKPSTK